MGNLDEIFVLEVGKQYYNRLGNPILIKSEITDTSSLLYRQGYRFIDNQDRPYTPRGRSTFGDIGNMDIERSIPGVFPESSKFDKKDDLMLEIERRFTTIYSIEQILEYYTVSNQPLTKHLIEQMYLPTSGDWTLRLRRITCEDGSVKNFLTLKTFLESFTDFELETEITEEQFQKTLEQFSDRPLLQKHRWTDPDGFEIDKFLNPELGGLVIIEIELESEDQPFHRMWYMGEEITGQKDWSNKSLYSRLIRTETADA